ncbi:unnamed protein product [Arabidopsis arenosa]|uniref:AN1-type domain-containing protein n=1 Tax=Arabidopsis arenosa TaxID=38785 RepID=A0A8S2ATG3_ARAAE|nr:unnamed protein product [Arabidopsis arenosa]
MGTPEFPDLGKHCSVDVCKQIDFMPFTCDRCFQVLCLDHRSYMKHDCPRDVTVVNTGEEDSNANWDKHVNNTDCDPSKKKPCPVPRCRELLTFSYTVKCRDCCIDHCLKHRFGPDHTCSGPCKQPDSCFSSTNPTVAATSTPASSSRSPASFFASLEARLRKTRRTRTRLNSTREGRVGNPPLWMVREGVDGVVRELRGQMIQEEEENVEWEEE